ncbi:MAG: Arc family DNA binding domain-containing protein [Pedobacter sp.]|nr:Arc family DNA binding domain-containing protein [Pedobacter sp.]
MSDKKSFALRIDSETMKAIEKWAADEFRSVNGQIEWMLNKSLKDAKRRKAKNEQKDDPEIRS